MCCKKFEFVINDQKSDQSAEITAETHILHASWYIITITKFVQPFQNFIDFCPK